MHSEYADQSFAGDEGGDSPRAIDASVMPSALLLTSGIGMGICAVVMFLSMLASLGYSNVTHALASFVAMTCCYGMGAIVLGLRRVMLDISASRKPVITPRPR